MPMKNNESWGKVMLLKFADAARAARVDPATISRAVIGPLGDQGNTIMPYSANGFRVIVQLYGIE